MSCAAVRAAKSRECVVFMKKGKYNSNCLLFVGHAAAPRSVKDKDTREGGNEPYPLRVDRCGFIIRRLLWVRLRQIGYD